MTFIYVDNESKILLNTDKVRDIHISTQPPKTYKVVVSFSPSGSAACASYTSLQLAKEHLERIRRKLCPEEEPAAPSQSETQK